MHWETYCEHDYKNQLRVDFITENSNASVSYSWHVPQSLTAKRENYGKVLYNTSYNQLDEEFFNVYSIVGLWLKPHFYI